MRLTPQLRSSIFLFILALLLNACGTAVTPQQERALGEQQARQVLHKARLSKNPTYNAHVRNVGRRIASVANRPDFHWQYYVLENKTPNAFVLPGGKIFVNSGLFKYVRSDAELATVISHEVAHALRSHGIEGAQRKQNASLVGALLQVGMGVAGVDPSIAHTVTQAYGYGATYGYIRPYSREKETEADVIGLMLMAKAGYDPRSALSFWKKFARQGQRVPEFFSTHPSTSHRIANLERLMPKAVALYKKNMHRHRHYASRR
jgi:predicted Zn-dependent protease